MFDLFWSVVGNLSCVCKIASSLCDGKKCYCGHYVILAQNKFSETHKGILVFTTQSIEMAIKEITIFLTLLRDM